MAVGEQRPSRIPRALQAVFLASNRGRDVHRPPPERVAQKEFFRNVFSSLTGKGRRAKAQKSTPTSPVSPKQTPNSKQTSRKAGLPPPIAVIRTDSSPTVSPQAFLDVMISTRGYSTTRTKTLSTAFHNRPTELQQASYDVHLIYLVRSRCVDEFRKIMASGISPNPCNRFGESLIHLVCRRGDAELLKIMLDNGSDVHVVDDYGRTPLHDACWAAEPCFDVVEMLLNVDKSLFHMTDRRGSVPLSYVHRDHWGKWIEWLESNKDQFWPARVAIRDGPEPRNPLLDQEPMSRPLPNPENALTPELAKMVASGRITPHEAVYLNQDEDKHTAEESDSDFDSEYDSDSDFDSDEESDDESESSFMADDELADVFQALAAQAAAASVKA